MYLIDTIGKVDSRHVEPCAGWRDTLRCTKRATESVRTERNRREMDGLGVRRERRYQGRD